MAIFFYFFAQGWHVQKLQISNNSQRIKGNQEVPIPVNQYCYIAIINGRQDRQIRKDVYLASNFSIIRNFEYWLMIITYV